MLETIIGRLGFVDLREVGTSKPDLELLWRIQTLGFKLSASTGAGAWRLIPVVVLWVEIADMKEQQRRGPLP